MDQSRCCDDREWYLLVRQRDGRCEQFCTPVWGDLLGEWLGFRRCQRGKVLSQRPLVEPLRGIDLGQLRLWQYDRPRSLERADREAEYFTRRRADRQPG